MLWNHACIHIKEKKDWHDELWRACDRQNKYFGDRDVTNSFRHLAIINVIDNAIRRTLRNKRRGDSARDVILPSYHAPFRKGGRRRRAQLRFRLHTKGAREHEDRYYFIQCVLFRTFTNDVERCGSGTRDEQLVCVGVFARAPTRRRRGIGKEQDGASTIVPPFPPSPIRMKSSGGNKEFFQKKKRKFC